MTRTAARRSSRVSVRLAYGPQDSPVACLTMLLEGAGYPISSDDVRARLASGRDGATLADLERAGLAVAGQGSVALASFDEARARGPVIVFPAARRPLIVESWGEVCTVVDPWAGRTKMPISAFSACTEALYANPNPENAHGRPVIPSWLRDLLAGQSTGIAFVLLAGLALVVPGLLAPALIRAFVDSHLEDGSTLPPTVIVLGLAATAALAAALVWLQLIGLARLTTLSVIRSTASSVWQLLRMPAWFHSERDASSLAFRIGLNEQIADLLAARLSVAVLAQITAACYLIGIAVIAPLLACIALCGYVIVLALLIPVARHRSEVRQRQARAASTHALHVGSTIRVLETLKATGSEDVAFARMYGAAGTRLTLGYTHLWAWFAMAPVLASGLTMAAVVGVGAALVTAGTITAGSMTAALMLVGGMLAPLAPLSAALDSALNARGPIEQLGDLLEQQVDPAFAATALPSAPPSTTRGSRLERARASGRSGSLAIDPWAGAMELKEVSFKFANGTPLIHDLSVSIPPASVTAIVGPSGSGKSTLGRLIAGLYHPSEGKILLDGIELTDTDRLRRAQNIAFIDQDVTLFQATVRTNITLFDSTIADSAVVRAARDAQVDRDISMRPGAYDAPVDEDGRNFSGGQRQRLVIARGLVRSPRVVILDEATSGLDAHTEARIIESLRERGCTVIMVAHRLSTVREADRILVLDAGEIVESGTHQSLIDVNGLYSRLVNA